MLSTPHSAPNTTDTNFWAICFFFRPLEQFKLVNSVGLFNTHDSFFVAKDMNQQE